MTLEERINKKKSDIEKRHNITLKLEKKLETLTDQFDIGWMQNDIKKSKNKEKELQVQLENLLKQQEKQKVKNSIERIPVIEDFLDQWKQNAIEWYKKDYQRISEYLHNKYEKEIQLQQWIKENKIFNYYGNPEILEKEKELGIDYESHKQYMKWQNQFTIKLLDYGNGWQSYLEKEMEKEKDMKRQIFIERVKEVTGNIQDASFLSIGSNGEINGIVKGEKGKASVRTISAGGYNIQCFHYRVLVKPCL